MVKYEIEIPEEVEIKIEKNKVTVKGPLGQVEREFKLNGIKTILEKDKLTLQKEEARKKQKAYLGSVRAHIKNMIKGVTKGHTYQLKIVYKHFPINVALQGNQLAIKNFAGEKKPRFAKILDGVKVDINNNIIELTGIDIEKVGQTAANIEQKTRIKDKDIRIFQDGIFIIKKSN